MLSKVCLRSSVADFLRRLSCLEQAASSRTVNPPTNQPSAYEKDVFKRLSTRPHRSSSLHFWGFCFVLWEIILLPDRMITFHRLLLKILLLRCLNLVLPYFKHYSNSLLWYRDLPFFRRLLYVFFCNSCGHFNVFLKGLKIEKIEFI